LVGEEVLEQMAQRLKLRPEKMKLRSQLVEHPFGTMKRGMNQRVFSTERDQEGGGGDEPDGALL